MHKLAVAAIVESVRRRASQGDTPVEAAQSVEVLEEVILTLTAPVLSGSQAISVAGSSDIRLGALPLCPACNTYGGHHHCPSFSAPSGSEPYCLGCQHAYDQCSHCGPRASEPFSSDDDTDRRTTDHMTHGGPLL